MTTQSLPSQIWGSILGKYDPHYHPCKGNVSGATWREESTTDKVVKGIGIAVLFGGFAAGIAGLIASAVFIPGSSDWRTLGMIGGGVVAVGSPLLLLLFLNTRKEPTHVIENPN